MAKITKAYSGQEFSWERKDGLFLLHIPQGMTMQKAFDLCKKECDLSAESIASLKRGVIARNQRDPLKEGYTIAFLDSDCPDLAYRGVSADKLSETPTITLLEHLLLETAYFLATEKHLGTSISTLCAGTRDTQDRVPAVRWLASAKLYVYWVSDDYKGLDKKIGTRVAQPLA